MVYKVEYNWLRFLNNPAFIEEWGSLILKEFSFFEVATNANSEKYAIRHWEYVSPTEMKNRRIRFLFDIVANSEEERRALLKRVQRAFTPEANPSPFNKNLWKDLSFLDVDCAEWKCKCQIYKWIELSDFANEKRVWISVELITDSPYFYSNQEYSITTTNTMSWIKLPVKLPFKRQYYRWVINYNGVISTPARIDMEILQNNSSFYPMNKIKIVCNSENWYEVLHLENISSLWLSIWDKIMIDTKNRRCFLTTVNWTEDITWLVSLWSWRPYLVWWTNVISIDTWDWRESIEAQITRNNIF